MVMRMKTTTKITPRTKTTTKKIMKTPTETTAKTTTKTTKKRTENNDLLVLVLLFAHLEKLCGIRYSKVLTPAFIGLTMSCNYFV